MKGFRLSAQSCGTLLLLACVLLSPSVDAAYTMNETCQYLYNGYIGDPTSCQGYGWCQNGVLVGTAKCTADFLFDVRSGLCKYADQAECQSTAQDICNNLSTAQIIADPNNCNRYCNCNNKALDCGNCPQYQVYNPSEGACVWGSKYQCSANSICRLVANNRFVADPTTCGNYIMCIAGGGVSKPCSTAGTMYNPATGTCDPNYQCSGNGAGVNENYPPIPGFCATKYVTPSTSTQFFDDSKTCFGYYACTSAAADGVWGKCPFGTHFNPTLQQCVTPYTYACEYDRCGNTNLQYVDDIGCESYTYCVNQTEYTTNNACPTNYRFYNEYEVACTATKPTFAICTVN